LIAIVLIALASLILGMGLPVTAAYIVLGTLSAPALFDLIANEQLVSAYCQRHVGDQAKTMLMLVSPDAAAQLGQSNVYRGRESPGGGHSRGVDRPIRESVIDKSALALRALVSALSSFSGSARIPTSRRPFA
jgi:hypothetical protein